MNARHAQRIRIETHAKKKNNDKLGVASYRFKGFHFGCILESGGCSVKQSNIQHHLHVEANVTTRHYNDNLTNF